MRKGLQSHQPNGLSLSWGHLENDAVMPDQFVQRSHGDDPGIRLLMMAVLGDAVHRLRVAERAADNWHAQLAAREARHWFAAVDTAYAFSFLRICETLNLDPGWIRRHLPAARHAMRRTEGGRTLVVEHEMRERRRKRYQLPQHVPA